MKLLYITTILILCSCLLLQCKGPSWFPFKIIDANGQYIIMAATESAELYPKYADLFRKYKYVNSKHKKNLV